MLETTDILPVMNSLPEVARGRTCSRIYVRASMLSMLSTTMNQSSRSLRARLAARFRLLTPSPTRTDVTFAKSLIMACLALQSIQNTWHLSFMERAKCRAISVLPLPPMPCRIHVCGVFDSIFPILSSNAGRGTKLGFTLIYGESCGKYQGLDKANAASPPSWS